MTDPKGNSEFCFSNTLIYFPRGSQRKHRGSWGKQNSLFPLVSAINWLVLGRMMSNDETVSYQMHERVTGIEKTLTSNGKQFTVTRAILSAGARDQRWRDVFAKEMQNPFLDSVGFKNPTLDFLKETHSDGHPYSFKSHFHQPCLDIFLI